MTQIDNMVAKLQERGVEIGQIAEIVYDLQQKYHPEITVEECTSHVLHVLRKREVQHALYTGIALDELAEQNALPQPLQAIMERDEPLYGVDEILALSITNVYGTIGLTNFGYLDKVKVGVLGYLNNHDTEIHVFLDDLIAAVAAAAAARIAHQHGGKPDDGHSDGSASANESSGANGSTGTNESASVNKSTGVNESASAGATGGADGSQEAADSQAD